MCNIHMTIDEMYRRLRARGVPPGEIVSLVARGRTDLIRIMLFGFSRPYSAITGDAYAVAALAAECDAIRHARDGAGNDTINTACLSIGQLVAAEWSGITYDDAIAAIWSALSGWTWDEPLDEVRDRNTVRHALADGMRNPRPQPEVDAKAQGLWSPLKSELDWKGL